MKLSKNSYTVTQGEADKMRDNLRAFSFNFKEPLLRKYKDKSFAVFMSEEDVDSGSYVQYCENIDYLNGWLYGAVQAVCGQLGKPKTDEEKRMELMKEYVGEYAMWDKIKMNNEPVITYAMIINGYKQQLINLIDSPNGDGIVCGIGVNWFYFGGLTAEDCGSVEEYKRFVPEDDIISEIYDVLCEFKTEFPDEYLYYYYYLKENVVDENE